MRASVCKCSDPFSFLISGSPSFVASPVKAPYQEGEGRELNEENTDPSSHTHCQVSLQECCRDERPHAASLSLPFFPSPSLSHFHSHLFLAAFLPRAAPHSPSCLIYIVDPTTFSSFLHLLSHVLSMCGFCSDWIKMQNFHFSVWQKGPFTPSIFYLFIFQMLICRCYYTPVNLFCTIPFLQFSTVSVISSTLTPNERTVWINRFNDLSFSSGWYSLLGTVLEAEDLR